MSARARRKSRPTEPKPGIEDLVAAELAPVREAVMAVENGVCQDDHDEGWIEAYMAVGHLVEAADLLKDRLEETVQERGL